MSDDYELPEEWTVEAKETFSRVYRHASANQQVFSHPDMGELPQTYWDTICWNFAWLAAICVTEGSDVSQLVHLNESGEVLAVEVTKETMQ